MSEAVLLNTACSSLSPQASEAGLGHKDNIADMDQQKLSNPEHSLSTNDPLDELDKIEVVQQSDTTILFNNDEEVSIENNISCMSLAGPIQLLGVFEEMSEKNTSPNAVDELDDVSSACRDEKSGNKPKQMKTNTLNHKNRLLIDSNPPLKLPHFELHESLQRTLRQTVIDRCSFYSVIHGINKAVEEMASEDRDGAIEDNQDEHSALIRAVNGPANVVNKREGPQVELAILDEERFLLAAIESRGEDEMAIRACPSGFAVAIGEIEPSSSSESMYSNGQTENPLSVLKPSKTQLWKPGRSWWEARSGKNPWIEPKHHNKRWRFLWPLIHYHKFLCKCIKKLKRNNIDVKTSMNPVPAFLREEVCAVSDHLAAISKFSSEDWMEGLPHFKGWTNDSKTAQKELKELIQLIPMRGLREPIDVDSALLRNQIDICFLKAMATARDQIENGRLETKSQEGSNNSYSAPANVKEEVNGIMRNESFASRNSSCRPPRHGGSRGSRGGRNTKMYGMSKQWQNQRHSHSYGLYHDQSMIMQHQPHFQHGYYPPHFNPSYHGGYVPNHFMHQSLDNSIMGWNNPYGGNDFSNLNMSMSSNYNLYATQLEHDMSFHTRCDDSVANTSFASHNNFEGHQQIPTTVNASFDEASLNGAEVNNIQTPSKNSKPTSSSPSWAHLHSVPGLNTPIAPHGPPMFEGPLANQNNGNFRGIPSFANAKPLLINHTYNQFPQGGGSMIPPSPATQFALSHQPSSHNHMYVQNDGYTKQMMNNGRNDDASNPVPDVMENTRTPTEDTSSETTSDTES